VVDHILRRTFEYDPGSGRVPARRRRTMGLNSGAGPDLRPALIGSTVRPLGGLRAVAALDRSCARRQSLPFRPRWTEGAAHGEW
jgi:hypothetical protein